MPSPDSSTNSLAMSLLEEGDRVLRICNACRYCEGFCAVFPAMERRVDFKEKDLHYLANLCHDCGECYYSCQYAPPHEFALNLPQTLAEIRRESFRKYAWPGWGRALFRWNLLALILGAVVAPVALFLLLRAYVPPAVLFAAHADAQGAFYQVMPHSIMVAAFGAAGFLIFVVLTAGFFRFWRETNGSLKNLLVPAIWWRAVIDTMRLRYLDGGEDAGCAYPSEVPSHARRWFHHLTFYGFLLCFAATAIAAFYHNILGYEAPYPWRSLPVMLGSLGGLGLLIGPAGLLWLKPQRDAELQNRVQSKMDVAFLVMLFLTSLSGFLLLLLRESFAMGVLLAVHLGIVMGLFLTMPYGKFVHGIYRFGALLLNASEKRRVAGENVAE